VQPLVVNFQGSNPSVKGDGVYKGGIFKVGHFLAFGSELKRGGPFTLSSPKLGDIQPVMSWQYSTRKPRPHR
jgi:hypothetical protein